MSTRDRVVAARLHRQQARGGHASKARLRQAAKLAATMRRGLLNFLVFWGVHTLLLWVASQLFSSIRFDTPAALLVSGLLFGVVNALLKPLLVLLTLPITVLTLGLFLLIINACILLLVAWLVPGFHLAGFWPAVGVGLFISALSFVLNLLMASGRKPA